MDLWTISSLNSEERNIRYYDPRLKLLLSQAWIQYTTQEKREEKKRKKGHPLFLSRFCGCPVLCSWCAHGGKRRGKRKEKTEKKKKGHTFFLSRFYGCPILTVLFLWGHVLPVALLLWVSSFVFYGCPVLFLFCFPVLPCLWVSGLAFRFSPRAEPNGTKGTKGMRCLGVNWAERFLL